MTTLKSLAAGAALLLLAAPACADSFTMAQVLGYPFISGLTAGDHGTRIAWARDVRGVRNVWTAEAPSFAPKQVTDFRYDDGQELTQLTFSPDGKTLVFVRGGDHDANWEAEGHLAPDPASWPDQAKVTIWAVNAGAAPVKIDEADAPALSSRGQLAYIKDDQVWTAPLDGKGKPQKLFFDRGKDGALAWSPDGSRLAFVSNRDDHSFIGIFSAKDKAIVYLAPSTNFDISPHWSPDGKWIAFARRPGLGGPPRPILKQTPDPWSLWVADTVSGGGHVAWRSPNTLPGSYPQTEGGDNLHWAAGGRLVFLAELDNWPHLYSVPAAGGTPLLLTPGAFMVEHVSISQDGRSLIYSANTGTTKDDDDRRHIFCVPVDKAQPVALTAGEGLEWSPVAADGGHVAAIAAGAKVPAQIALFGSDGKGRRMLGEIPKDFPSAALIVPQSVSWKALDGTVVHGQLFAKADGTAAKPGLIFVHGGPPRQMLLGWHYMDYYSNAYAVNQYLAAHGFVVLSVNYRLGIGYGRAFQHPDRAGPTGAAEYQDVLAGAKFLQAQKGVDPKRIGIWGGSYGGYLTAMGLARNSDIFKAGVDFHGVHDWSRFMDTWFGPSTDKRFEKGDLQQAMGVAWTSSPESSMATWKSPVLLIHGDDDRNVGFSQTVDLARRLEALNIPHDELVIPNEIHGFLRSASWLKADSAAAAYFKARFGN